MSTYRVVVSDQVFPDLDIERSMLSTIDADLEVSDGTVEGLRAHGRYADAILNTYLPIDGSTLAMLHRVRIIARYGIGVDNVDVTAAAQRGVTVTNVPDYSVEEVAAHALSLMLACLRKLPQSDAKVRSFGWGLDGLRPMRRISTLTVGLVGWGRIARQLARSLKALGASVVAFDPYVEDTAGSTEMVPLDDLLSRSDVVSIHVPLTEETRGLFDSKRVAQMRPGSVLVNTARGPIVELGAVLDALRTGHLSGAGLDVFDPEPLDPSRIAGVPGLIVTPHTGFYSEESIAESQRKATTQVIKALTGEPVDYPIRP